jgi:GNAT superfamily N-acetyltransferase
MSQIRADANEPLVWLHTAEPPPGAEGLFGSEVLAAWSAARGDAGPLTPRPIILGILENTTLAAGLFGWIEPDDSPDAERDGLGPASQARPATAPDDTRGPAVGPLVFSIRQLVIPPSQRGKGLGPRLVRRAVELAREQACGRARSTAGWGCPDHLFLYERQQFKRAASSDRPYLVAKFLAAR